MGIKKKVWMPFFQEMLDGKKNFDIRLNDFECNVGDILVLEEWDQNKNEYTGRKFTKEIKYVLKTKNVEFWKPEEIQKYGFQVLGF